MFPLYPVRPSVTTQQTVAERAWIAPKGSLFLGVSTRVPAQPSISLYPLIQKFDDPSIE
jgi:hypothetical protein